MPMWGWQAAAQINLTPRLFISGGYSDVYKRQIEVIWLRKFIIWL